MNFNPSYNIDNEEKYGLIGTNCFNVKFNIEDGDLLSLACEEYDGKWFKFKLDYCEKTKTIVPFEIINKNLNKIIDVCFEYYDDTSDVDDVLFKVHLTDFSFTGYLNLFNLFEEKKSPINSDDYVDNEEEINDIITVLYTFSGFYFENGNVNKLRKDKLVDILSESENNIKAFVDKKNLFYLDENGQIKNVE
jgi:hypothetical protein